MKHAFALVPMFLFLFSCSFSEEDATKVANNFMTAYQFNDEETMVSIYEKMASFSFFAHFESFEIKNVVKSSKGGFVVYVKMIRKSQLKEVVLYLKNMRGKLKIVDSKGLIYTFDSLYRIGKEYNCFNDDMSDVEIAEAMQGKIGFYDNITAHDYFSRILKIQDFVYSEANFEKVGYLDNLSFRAKITNNSNLKFRTDDVEFHLNFYEDKNMLKSFKLITTADYFNPGEEIEVFLYNVYPMEFYIPDNFTRYDMGIKIDAEKELDCYVYNFGFDCETGIGHP